MNVLRKKFLVRLLATCFVGIHTPLIVVFAVNLVSGDAFDWRTIALLFLATVAGTGLTLFVLQREIMPVVRVARALEGFADRREVLAIDHDAPDEIGALARAASWAIDKADILLREIEREAGTDDLTRLPNRRAFMDLAQIRPDGSIAILDIDRFKAINDGFGHHTGDYVLKTVGRLLREALQPADVLARWGGEEFVVLLPESSPDEAAHRLDRARQAVAAARVLDGHPVTFSAGVTARSGDVHADLARADRAMYRAKHAGRNRVATADATPDRRLIDAPLLGSDPDFGMDLPPAKSRTRA